MSKFINRLSAALKKAQDERPKVGGFPYLAETLRRAGVVRNIWILPACQSTYFSNDEAIVSLLPPLVNGLTSVQKFNRESLIRTLRINQAGESTFPEFLADAWNAGVVRYEVNFIARNVVYYGAQGEEYLEEYPAVEVIV